LFDRHFELGEFWKFADHTRPLGTPQVQKEEADRLEAIRVAASEAVLRALEGGGVE
jgi:hypothetical protein